MQHEGHLIFWIVTGLIVVQLGIAGGYLAGMFLGRLF